MLEASLAATTKWGFLRILSRALCAVQHPTAYRKASIAWRCSVLDASVSRLRDADTAGHLFPSSTQDLPSVTHGPSSRLFGCITAGEKIKAIIPSCESHTCYPGCGPVPAGDRPSGEESLVEADG